MAPETVIGASTPISGSGGDLNSDERAKAANASKAAIRDIVAAARRRSACAGRIDDRRSQSRHRHRKRSKPTWLILWSITSMTCWKRLNGFTVQVNDEPRTLNTADAQTEPLDMSFIEQFLLMLTDPNIVFTLLSIGTTALLIEISSPGGWVAGFIGVVCLTLAIYGMGILPVNWFGIIFLLTAFVLFILDIKAPTHGALTTAGVARSLSARWCCSTQPSTPQFQRVSVPLVVGIGDFPRSGILWHSACLPCAQCMCRSRMGMESYVGKTGTARTAVGSRRRTGPGGIGTVERGAILRVRNDR